MKPENHTMNGTEKRKEISLGVLIHSVKNLTWANALTLAGIVVFLFGTYSFVNSTKSTNNDLPKFKSEFSEYKKEDAADKKAFIQTLNEIKLSVKDIQADVRIVNQKVDDMKAHGFGRYHEETRELIRKRK